MFKRASSIAAAALVGLVGCGGGNSSATTWVSPQLERGAAATPAQLTASPQPLDFTMPAASQAFTISDPGYSGVLKAKPAKACRVVAKLSALKAAGPSGTFDVTSIGAGRCDVTVRDSKGNAITETIHVTVTKGSINERLR